jgi:hypothetical protein
VGFDARSLLNEELEALLALALAVVTAPEGQPNKTSWL